MTRTSIAFLAAACALAGCRAHTHHSAEHAAHARPSADQEFELVEVVALQHAIAHEAAAVLKSTLGKRSLRIEPYARTNSVVLAGDAVSIEHAKRLLAQLDIEVPQPER